VIDARRSALAGVLSLAATITQPFPVTLAQLGAWLVGSAIGAVFLTLAGVEAARIRREREVGR